MNIKNKVKTIVIALFQVTCNLIMTIFYMTIFLTFIISNQEYLQTLPVIIKLCIPLALLISSLRIVTLDWCPIKMENQER